MEPKTFGRAGVVVSLVAVLALCVLVALAGVHMVSAAPDEKLRVPACETEDGSTQRTCHWDAQTQGNGEGRSFTSFNYGETVVYDSER